MDARMDRRTDHFSSLIEIQKIYLDTLKEVKFSTRPVNL